MKYFWRYLLAASVIVFFVACSHKGATVNSKEGYIGNWKVNDPRLGVYYLTLKADGSGSSTRGGGEFGKWRFVQDHIELEWVPKNLEFYFNPGQTAPMKNPSVIESKDVVWSAEKVDKIP